MSEQKFNIVFYGIIQPGKDRDTVVSNMAAMFKTEPARVKSYFSGDRKIIKSNVDTLTAEKYRTALENIGLVIKIEAATPADGKSAQMAQIDDGGLSMAAVGADIIENPVAVQPQPIGDTSGISMAEVGANVIEKPRPVKPQPIADISAISLAEVGANIIENPKPAKKAPAPDINGLSLD